MAGCGVVVAAMDDEVTPEECTRLGNALESPEFRRLLTEYVDEINDPEKRAIYETEVVQLEKQRGYDVTFIHPEPRYVLKTSRIVSETDGNVTEPRKTFVNIASSDSIDRPSSCKRTSTDKDDGVLHGIAWSLPYSLSPPRQDTDKKGHRCTVYDCVFHPETLDLALTDQRLTRMIRDIALEGIEQHFNVRLNKTNVKSPRLKYMYKGTPMPTLKRRKIVEEKQLDADDGHAPAPAPPLKEHARQLSENRSSSSSSSSVDNHPCPLAPTAPEYSIKYRHHPDLQDHAYNPSSEAAAVACRPTVELVVVVSLPSVESSSEVQLDVQPNELYLKSVDGQQRRHSYKLELKLPCAVREDEGRAQFDSDKRLLSIVLPTYKEDGHRPARTASKESAEDALPVCAAGEGCRASSEEDDSEARGLTEQLSKLDVSENDQSLDDASVADHSAAQMAAVAAWVSGPLLPDFSCHQDEQEIVFVLRTEHVLAESLKVAYLHEGQACHVTYTSLGAGTMPFWYSLFLRFPCTCKVDEAATTLSVNEDSIVIIFKKYLTARHNWLTYFYDTDGQHELNEAKIEVNSLQESLNALWNDSKKAVDPTHTCAINPLPVSIVEVNSERLVVAVKFDKDKAENINVDDAETWHGEGHETLPVQSNDIVQHAEDGMQTSGRLEHPQENVSRDSWASIKKCRKARSISESSDDQLSFSPSRRPRGILKHGRFPRTVSESSDDFCWSSQDYTTIDSDIPEENISMAHSYPPKKSVHFDNYILLKKFSLNSKIGEQRQSGTEKQRIKGPASMRRSSESEFSEEEEENLCVSRRPPNRCQKKANKNAIKHSTKAKRNDNETTNQLNGNVETNGFGSSANCNVRGWPTNDNAQSLQCQGKARRARHRRSRSARQLE